jgi:predicted RNA binding protein YcfA (HicA-like mRNA interferase family)
MKLPRNLDGDVAADKLCKRFGYRKIHQVGSHIILQCDAPSHRIAIPAHSPLRIGTLSAIAQARGISKAEVVDALG